MEQLRNRIEEIAKYKQVSIRQMEVICQLKRGNLSNISKDGTIGLDKASKIIDTFPDVSPDWLISGKGPMLRNDFLKGKEGRIVVGQTVNGDIHNNGMGKVNISSVSLAPSNIHDDAPLIKQMEQRPVKSTLNSEQEYQAEILMERSRTLEAEIEGLRSQLKLKDSELEWLRVKYEEEVAHSRGLVKELLTREKA